MKAWTTPVVEEITFTQTHHGSTEFTTIDGIRIDDATGKPYGDYGTASAR